MLSPYSALSLVRQRIHVLCSSFSLGDDFKMVSVFSAQLGLIVDTRSASAYRALEVRRILRYAWFNSGYKFMRHSSEAGLLFFPLVRPMMRCIMAGMYRRTVMHLAVAVLAGFAGDFAPRAVLSSLVGTPTILGIMAGMARKTASRFFLAVTSARLVLPVTMHLALCLLG